MLTRKICLQGFTQESCNRQGKHPKHCILFFFPFFLLTKKTSIIYPFQEMYHSLTNLSSHSIHLQFNSYCYRLIVISSLCVSSSLEILVFTFECWNLLIRCGVTVYAAFIQKSNLNTLWLCVCICVRIIIRCFCCQKFTPSVSSTVHIVHVL